MFAVIAARSRSMGPASCWLAVMDDTSMARQREAVWPHRARIVTADLSAAEWTGQLWPPNYKQTLVYFSKFFFSSKVQLMYRWITVHLCSTTWDWCAWETIGFQKPGKLLHALHQRYKMSLFKKNRLQSIFFSTSCLHSHQYDAYLGSVLVLNGMF